MKSRYLAFLLLSLLVAGCGGEAAEDMDADAAAEAAGETEMSEAMSADEAAIDQIRLDYMQHYNMHHPDVVAEMHDDSAVWLGANGMIAEGKDEIQAMLEGAMEGSPTLDLQRRDMMVFGDFAVAMGDYTLQMTPPEGSAMSVGGHYLSGFQRVDGQWKLIGAITNYNAPPPEGMTFVEGDNEEPPEDGTMTALVEAYETHFNLGHADMVADLFTEDAVAAFGNLPISEGRAAVQSAIEQRLAMGDNPQVDIHDVYTMELGDGWAVDSGWYVISAGGEPVQDGTYILLNRQQEDGSWKIHWMVSNAQPAS